MSPFRKIKNNVIARACSKQSGCSIFLSGLLRASSRNDGDKKLFGAESKIFFLIFSCIIFFFSCQNQKEKKEKKEIKPDNTAITYASWFDYEEFPDYTKLIVKNPWKQDADLRTYILVPKNRELPENLPAGTVLRTPLERVVCFPAVACSFLKELTVDSTIVGVAESQYIHIESIQEGIKNGQILDVGQASNPDSEKLLLVRPEAIFANTIQDAGYGQIEKTGIPVIECIEYMENIPLGQSEWIKFISLFFDKQEFAGSLFNQITIQYNEIKDLALKVQEKPTVFTEMLYGSVWYLPGGKSYIAHILEDAGADYIWKENANIGSLNFSFEQVLEKAEKADYWLIKYYNNQEMTYSSLKALYQNYTLFQAYQKKHIYTLNTMEVPYYEELAIHPEIMLKDLVAIFHPELLPGYKSVYYREMEE